MPKPWHLFALAGCALLQWGTAHAGSTLSASVTGITITTTGVVTMNNAVMSTTVQANDFAYTDSDAVFVPNDDYPSVSGPWQTPQDLRSASSSATAHASATETTLLAEVSTGAWGGIASAQASLYAEVALGAYSSIVIAWSASTTGYNDGSKTPLMPTYDFQFHDYLEGWLQADAGQQSETLEGAGGYDDIQGQAFSFSLNPTSTQSELVFTTGAAPQSLFFNISAYALTQDYANPVPEPETWALALVGLWLAGAAARRRLSHRAKQGPSGPSAAAPRPVTHTTDKPRLCHPPVKGPPLNRNQGRDSVDV